VLRCIIRNDARIWLVKCAKPLGTISNNLVELEALKEGLKLSLKKGIQSLYIEGDTQIVLNALRKRTTSSWILNSKLE
jgi:ribonuclease HI